MIEGFGSRLTMLRAAKGMTIAQLAGQLHISSSVISRYESDERLPSFSGLIKLAHFFGVSTDYLLEWNRFRIPSHQQHPLTSLV